MTHIETTHISYFVFKPTHWEHSSLHVDAQSRVKMCHFLSTSTCQHLYKSNWITFTFLTFDFVFVTFHLFWSISCTPQVNDTTKKWHSQCVGLKTALISTVQCSNQPLHEWKKQLSPESVHELTDNGSSTMQFPSALRSFQASFCSLFLVLQPPVLFLYFSTTALMNLVMRPKKWLIQL